MCDNYYPMKKKRKRKKEVIHGRESRATKLIHGEDCATASPTSMSLLCWKCRELVNSRANCNLCHLVTTSMSFRKVLNFNKTKPPSR